MKLRVNLFKKDQRSRRVAAIVEQYSELQMPPPRELMEVMEKEGLVPPPLAHGRPAVPAPEQSSPVPEPAKAAAKEIPVSAPRMPAAPVEAVPEKAPAAPAAVRGPEQEEWVQPSYTQSRAVVLDPGRLAANRCVGYRCGSYESEAYKVLRTRLLQKTGEQGGTTIMVTSALPGEGKTLTAINLGLTFAKEYNQTVLLVDSDLHKQRVHEYLGYDSKRGLTDHLLKGTALSEIIVWPGVEKFTVISGSRTVTATSELLRSPRMKDLVRELKSRYPDRYVIFDVPPVLAGADALAFAPQVDHIILVVRAGSTSIEDVKLAMDLLPRNKVLGFVLNRADQAGMISRYKQYKEDKEAKADQGIKSKWERLRKIVSGS